MVIFPSEVIDPPNFEMMFEPAKATLLPGTLTDDASGVLPLIPEMMLASDPPMVEMPPPKGATGKFTLVFESERVPVTLAVPVGPVEG
jgi:hypothetical protein